MFVSIKLGSTSTRFTIVEPLIVVMVIVILAAISNVAYTRISNRAHDSAIQNDPTSFAKLAQMYQVDKGVHPPISQLGSLNLRVAKSSYESVGHNLYYCTDGGVKSTYGFAAKSKSARNSSKSSCLYRYQKGILSNDLNKISTNFNEVSTLYLAGSSIYSV